MLASTSHTVHDLPPQLSENILYTRKEGRTMNLYHGKQANKRKYYLYPYPLMVGITYLGKYNNC